MYEKQLQDHEISECCLFKCTWDSNQTCTVRDFLVFLNQEVVIPNKVADTFIHNYMSWEGERLRCSVHVAC